MTLPFARLLIDPKGVLCGDEVKTWWILLFLVMVSSRHTLSAGLGGRELVLIDSRPLDGGLDMFLLDLLDERPDPKEFLLIVR